MGWAREARMKLQDQFDRGEISEEHYYKEYAAIIGVPLEDVVDIKNTTKRTSTSATSTAYEDKNLISKLEKLPEGTKIVEIRLPNGKVIKDSHKSKNMDQETTKESEKDSGYIYIISNPSMPGLIKIGFTAGPVKERLTSLNTTGVPTPFKIEYSQRVSQVKNVEKSLHYKFNKHRINKNREFFKLPVSAAIQALKEYPVYGSKEEKLLNELRAKQKKENELLAASLKQRADNLRVKYSDFWRQKDEYPLLMGRLDELETTLENRKIHRQHEENIQQIKNSVSTSGVIICRSLDPI